MNSFKKRAPAPPPGTLNSNSSQYYGTLPHPPRHSQNFDSTDIRTVGNHNNQSIDVAYGTLPHLRSVDSSPRITNLGSHGFFDRFEKSVSQDPGGGMAGLGVHEHTTLSTFGHKRSPSGESLNRNRNLAGAKLVLPTTGEMPTLKHVDK